MSAMIIRRLPRQAVLATRRTAQRTYATSDYGSPTSSADPASKPQSAGPNPSADKEHPGPPPPSAGQNTGGATKADAEGHKAPTGQQADVQPTKGNVAQKRGFHSGTAWSFRVSGVRATEGKPEPKIHDPPAPKEGKEVKEHNKDFEKRTDRAHEGSAEKVEKGYWREGEDGRPKQG